jgi:hypothetical protein
VTQVHGRARLLHVREERLIRRIDALLVESRKLRWLTAIALLVAVATAVVAAIK